MSSFRPISRYYSFRRAIILLPLFIFFVPSLIQSTSQATINPPKTPRQVADPESNPTTSRANSTLQGHRFQGTLLSNTVPINKSLQSADVNKIAHSAQPPLWLASFIHQYNPYLQLLLSAALLSWLFVFSLWTYFQLSTLKHSFRIIQGNHQKLKQSFDTIRTSYHSPLHSYNEISHSLASSKPSTSKNYDTLSAKLDKLDDQSKEALNPLTTKQSESQTCQPPSSSGSRDHDSTLSKGLFFSTNFQPTTLSAETTPKSDPAQELVAFFHDAFYRNDRSALRTLNPQELIITEDTENNLVRRIANTVTQLQIVNGGGSYFLIDKGGSHWLLPTFQTLIGFTSSQPAKGIFSFHPESVSRAELRYPAEIKEVGGLWQVINMGVVAIPT
jgi:hypothetical protein